MVCHWTWEHRTMTVGANLWGEQGEQHLRHWQMVERKQRASIREHVVRWSSLTLMRFTTDFWTVKDVTKRPWIFWPHLTPLPSPREGSLTSCLQTRLDKTWCLNLCKVKCISNYTLYSSNHFVHRLPMQMQRVD